MENADYFCVKSLKEGDVYAFKQLFELLYPKLMALACRFVDNEAARDVVQDVFTDYWEKKQNLDAAIVSSYLHKSVQNKCLNHVKHQAVVDDYVSNVKVAHARMEYLTNNTDDNDLFRQITNQNLRELIEASVVKLPPKCQEAFRLCFYNEMSSKKAAEQMGVSPRTVEGHIQQALVKLRKDLHPFLFWLLFSGSGFIFQN